LYFGYRSPYSASTSSSILIRLRINGINISEARNPPKLAADTGNPTTTTISPQIHWIAREPADAVHGEPVALPYDEGPRIVVPEGQLCDKKKCETEDAQTRSDEYLHGQRDQVFGLNAEASDGLAEPAQEVAAEVQLHAEYHRAGRPKESMSFSTAILLTLRRRLNSLLASTPVRHRYKLIDEV
jgi:hypothetical protein